MRDRVCKRCGDLFDGGPEEHYYCDDCLAEMDEEDKENSK